MPENHFLLFEDKIQNERVLLQRPRPAVQNARKGFPSCEIEKDHFTDSQGKQIRIENKEPLNQKFWNKSYIALQ